MQLETVAKVEIVPRAIHGNEDDKLTLQQLDRDGQIMKRFIVDCKTLESTQYVMDLLTDIGMTTRNYHFLITTFVSVTVTRWCSFARCPSNVILRTKLKLTTRFTYDRKYL